MPTCTDLKNIMLNEKKKEQVAKRLNHFIIHMKFCIN